MNESMSKTMNRRNSAFTDFDIKEEISYGEYCPETDSLLYAVSRYDTSVKKRGSRIILHNRTTGEDRTITAGGYGESNPMFSSDYKRVLFLSGTEHAGTQLFVCDLESDSVRQLTTMRFGLMDPIWSPDGKWILFTSFSSGDMDEDWLQTIADEKEQADYARERAKEPVVITDFGYKFDGLGFSQPEVMQLWVVPSDGSAKAKRITSGNANFMHASWAPDSQAILCESNLYCDKENSIAMDVLLVDIATCAITRVTKDQMVVSYPNPMRPVFTPDGKYIIVGILDNGEDLSQNVDGDDLSAKASREETKTGQNETYPSCGLYRITPDGKEQTRICEKTAEAPSRFRQWISRPEDKEASLQGQETSARLNTADAIDCYDCVQFPYNAGCGRGLEKMRISSDGQSVFFHSGSNGAATLWKVNIYGERHIPQKLAGGKYAYNGLGVPSNGKVLVTRTETNCPEGYYLLDEVTGELELLLQSNEDWLQTVNLSRAEDFFFDTLDGESRVHGFGLPPQGCEEGKKYPVICYVHGGPHPFYTYGFDLEMQCFAGEGFGIIFCNPRGSSGYGDVHRNVDRAFDGSAYTDILQFVQEACNRFPWVDANRIGLTGGSYGGYMTNYMASRTKRFKAFITQRSISNDLISYASSDMQGESKDYPTFGEFMVHQIEKSVICGMEKVSAPFLILHGMEDYRCPVEEAHQLFVALKDSHPEDFPIKMVLYPHCGHEQPTEPRQRQHYYRTMVEWLRAYL